MTKDRLKDVIENDPDRQEQLHRALELLGGIG